MRFKLLGALLLLAVLALVAIREIGRERAERARVDPSRESRRGRDCSGSGWSGRENAAWRGSS